MRTEAYTEAAASISADLPAIAEAHFSVGLLMVTAVEQKCPTAGYLLIVCQREEMNMGKSENKEYKTTVRYDGEFDKILTKMSHEYHISKSECMRQGILRLKNPAKANVLPQLCRVCSVVNEMLEKSTMNEEEKEYLKGELKEVWEQLQ